MATADDSTAFDPRLRSPKTPNKSNFPPPPSDTSVAAASVDTDSNISKLRPLSPSKESNLATNKDPAKNRFAKRTAAFRSKTDNESASGEGKKKKARKEYFCSKVDDLHAQLSRRLKFGSGNSSTSSSQSQSSNRTITYEFQGKESLEEVIGQLFQFPTSDDVSFLKAYQSLKQSGITVCNHPTELSTDEKEILFKKLQNELTEAGAFDEENWSVVSKSSLIFKSTDDLLCALQDTDSETDGFTPTLNDNAINNKKTKFANPLLEENVIQIDSSESAESGEFITGDVFNSSPRPVNIDSTNTATTKTLEGEVTSSNINGVIEEIEQHNVPAAPCFDLGDLGVEMQPELDDLRDFVPAEVEPLIDLGNDPHFEEYLENKVISTSGSSSDGELVPLVRLFSEMDPPPSTSSLAIARICTINPKDNEDLEHYSSSIESAEAESYYSAVNPESPSSTGVNLNDAADSDVHVSEICSSISSSSANMSQNNEKDKDSTFFTSASEAGMGIGLEQIAQGQNSQNEMFEGSPSSLATTVSFLSDDDEPLAARLLRRQNALNLEEQYQSKQKKGSETPLALASSSTAKKKTNLTATDLRKLKDLNTAEENLLCSNYHCKSCHVRVIRIKNNVPAIAITTNSKKRGPGRPPKKPNKSNINIVKESEAGSVTANKEDTAITAIVVTELTKQIEMPMPQSPRKRGRPPKVQSPVKLTNLTQIETESKNSAQNQSEIKGPVIIMESVPSTTSVIENTEYDSSTSSSETKRKTRIKAHKAPSVDQKIAQPLFRVELLGLGSNSSPESESELEPASPPATYCSVANKRKSASKDKKPKPNKNKKDKLSVDVDETATVSIIDTSQDTLLPAPPQSLPETSDLSKNEALSNENQEIPEDAENVTSFLSQSEIPDFVEQMEEVEMEIQEKEQKIPTPTQPEPEVEDVTLKIAIVEDKDVLEDKSERLKSSNAAETGESQSQPEQGQTLHQIIISTTAPDPDPQPKIVKRRPGPKSKTSPHLIKKSRVVGVGVEIPKTSDVEINNLAETAESSSQNETLVLPNKSIEIIKPESSSQMLEGKQENETSTIPKGDSDDDIMIVDEISPPVVLSQTAASETPVVRRRKTVSSSSSDSDTYVPLVDSTQMETPKRRKSDEKHTAGKSKPKRRSSGSSWSGSPSSHAEGTQEDYLKRMQDEMEKPSPKVDYLKWLVAKTRDGRSDAFDDIYFDIEDGLNMYPALKHYEVLKYEFNHLTKAEYGSHILSMIELENRLQDEMTNALKVKKQPGQTRHRLWVKARKELHKDDGEMSKEKKQVLGMICLCFHLAEDSAADTLFCVRKEGDKIKSEKITTPRMDIRESELFSTNAEGMFIYAEGEKHIQVPNVYQGVLAIFALHFYFRLRYDPELTTLFEHFEQLAKVAGGESSKKAMTKKFLKQ